MSSFKDLRIVDNFYQTSLFFPMPVVLIGTLSENGQPTFGPYSLIQPYYVAGKDCYAMLLNCRNSSNTAQNLLRTGKCTVNFVTEERRTFKNIIKLSWPGDTTEEKMKKFGFTCEEGLMAKEDPENADKYPKVVTESFQAMECTWMRELDGADVDKPGKLDGYPGPYHDFNGITSEFGSMFILKIDKILMKPKYHDAIINGVKSKDFPPVPVDYGYRDSKNFWYHKHRRAIPELLPMRQATLESVRYAADRADDKVKFTDGACMKLIKVPRIFLPTALKGCVEWARENNVTLVTAEHMDIINDKRSKEKNK